MSDRSTAGLRRAKPHIVALVVYTGLTLALTYPLILQLDTHLAGDDIDVWINPWTNWWFTKAISGGSDPYYTDYLFYPQGVSLVFHSFSPLNTFFWWVLKPLCGAIAAYNVTILFAYAMSGYTMWLLARYWTGSAYAAFLAGVVFAFSPYHMSEASHPDLVSTQWMPLFALFFVKSVRRGDLRHGIVSSFLLVLSALSSWHLLAFPVLWALVYLVYTGVLENRLFKWEVWRTLLVFGVLTLLFLAPLLYPMGREQMTGDVAYSSVEFDMGVGNHPLSFLVPSYRHPILSQPFASANQLLGCSASHPAYLSYTVLVLALHAALKGQVGTRSWTIASVVFVLLSLGPSIPLRTGGAIELPWARPVVALFRHPWRLNTLISFSISMLAACDLTSLLERVRRPRPSQAYSFRPICITIGITTLVLLEYLAIPFPTTSPEVPSFYVSLAEEGDTAVVEIPIGRQADKFSMYYQTIHGKPLVGGHVSRTPPDAYDYIEDNQLLHAAWKGNPTTLSASDSARAATRLVEDGVRYVILKKYLLQESAVEDWRSLLQGPEIYEDDMLVVYPTACLVEE